MNTFTTEVSRDHYKNLKVESTIRFGLKLELSIYSKKSDSGYLYTQASVSHVDGPVRTHMLYTDMSRMLQQEVCTRVTEKKLLEFHNRINLAEVLAEAKQFYNVNEG
jgi:hypothetical protein